MKMHVLGVIVVALLGLVPGLVAQQEKPAGDKKAPKEVKKEGAEVGKPAPAFELKNTEGKVVKLDDFKDKIVVLQWVNPGCPVCQRVMGTGVVGRMLDDLKAAKKDLVWIPVSSTATARAEDVATYLTDFRIEAKALMDNDGKVGKAYGAKTTPHVFVIDDKSVLRYSGAIDDDAPGEKPDKAVNYALQAVKAIVAGETVKPETTKPYGCSVKYQP